MTNKKREESKMEAVKCERCGFEYQYQENPRTVKRCPQCGWRQLHRPDGEVDEVNLNEEETLRKNDLPPEVMFSLCTEGRRLVGAIIGLAHCLTYEDKTGEKHTLWPGRHTDPVEVWMYWVHPRPFLGHESSAEVAAVLVFEYQVRGSTHHEVEVYGKQYPLLAMWNC